MAVIALLGSYGNGTVIDGPEVAAEWQQIIDLLAGTSSTKNAKIKYSDATVPPLNLNQTGAGPILTLQVSGSDVYTTTNTGTPSATTDIVRKEYADSRKITSMHTVYVAGALSVSAILAGAFIVPSGLTSPAAISASFVHYTNTTSGASTIDVVRRRSAANTVIGTITVPNSTAVQTVVTQDFADDSLSAGDVIFFDVTAVGATPPSNSTIQLNWEQKVRS